MTHARDSSRYFQIACKLSRLYTLIMSGGSKQWSAAETQPWWLFSNCVLRRRIFRNGSLVSLVSVEVPSNGRFFLPFGSSEKSWTRKGTSACTFQIRYSSGLNDFKVTGFCYFDFERQKGGSEKLFPVEVLFPDLNRQWFLQFGNEWSVMSRPGGEISSLSAPDILSAIAF